MILLCKSKAVKGAPKNNRDVLGLMASTTTSLLRICQIVVEIPKKISWKAKGIVQPHEGTDIHRQLGS